VDYLMTAIPHPGFRAAMRQELLWNRQLDSRNANQATIGGDFGRLGLLDFWTKVDAVFANNGVRRRWFDDLNTWRNAIAHQTFDAALLGGSTNWRLATVQRWRRGCNKLARSLDRVLQAYIASVPATLPW
jgi:hypothetical protein